MNCRDFEPLLVESARQARPAASRSQAADVSAALEHAASCPTCGDRLIEERGLAADLSALSAAGAAREPSAGCEAILMAAYRVERGREVHTRRWIFALSGAMAASLVVLLGTALLLSRESGTLVRSMASRFSSHPAPALPGGLSAVVEEDASRADSDQEEVTDFVAFYPGADAGSLDSGALVRVRVPSSALGSFGMPVAQASGQAGEEEWVSADLLVAEDGSPLAIRFVRPATQVAQARD
ncbi:MAG TPA: hypothetical protein VKG84_09560 [Candidatus Acidoferrales bacterium]|nr:hypothetical protein [Candidatus Acidoferrales bacterium]